MAWWEKFYHTMVNQLALFGISDIIDILIVSYALYRAFKFIRDTKAVQLLKGVVFVIIITQVSFFAKLNTVYYILSNFMQLGMIALIIVFQPELRRILEHAGRTTGKMFNQHNNDFGAEAQQVIREISRAASAMSNARTGALIVIERDDNIDTLISSGVSISGTVTGELLDLEGRLEQFGRWLKIKTGNSNEQGFVNAFVTASLTVCVGAMAVLGAIQDGISGDYTTLALEGLLDLVIICIMTTVLGKGCIFASVPVFIFQGLITLLARIIAPVMTDAALDHLALTGSMLILCVGINLLWENKLRVANMLPTILFSVIFAFLPI